MNAAVREKLAGATTRTLLEGLYVLDQKPRADRTEDERLARAWLIEEIEHRHPEVNAAMDAWADDPDTQLGYVEALTIALPAEALR